MQMSSIAGGATDHLQMANCLITSRTVPKGRKGAPKRHAKWSEQSVQSLMRARDLHQRPLIGAANTKSSSPQSNLASRWQRFRSLSRKSPLETDLEAAEDSCQTSLAPRVGVCQLRRVTLNLRSSRSKQRWKLYKRRCLRP